MSSGFNIGFLQGTLASGYGFGTGFTAFPGSALPSNYAAGIKADRYTQGYFNDVLSWFDALTPTTTTYPTDKIEDPASDDGEVFSRRWTGYFRAPETATYTFYLSSDDASYMWIGASALSGWSTANALINNGGLHGAVEVSGAVSLVAGTLYPILVFFGEQNGGDVLTFSYSTLSISKTTNLTGLIYYNTSAQDGRGF